MDEIIKKLFEAFEAKRDDFIIKSKLFGYDNDLTKTALHEVMGFEEAFKIVAGMTTTDYLLKHN